jgi:FkbM family methyltransferase
MKKLIYYILNLTFHRYESEILKLLKNEKKLVIFDVGCYRGVFTKKILHSVKKRKFKFYLFDINRNSKKYLSELLTSRNITYNEVALSNKNGMAEYNYNSFFEASGSSLSSLFKKDTKWTSSRKLILKILFQNVQDYVKYQVPTVTLDTFVKKKKIKSIEILKVDIEGSEYEFLQGAKGTLKKNKIKIILIEISDRKDTYKKKEKKIIDFLKKRKFTFLKKHPNLSVSLFSDLKSGDYLFINNNYLK